MMKFFFFFLAFSFAVIPSETNAQGRWLRYRKYLSTSISNPILTIVSVGVLIYVGLKIGPSFSRWSWVRITLYCQVLYLFSREIPRLSSAIIN